MLVVVMVVVVAFFKDPGVHSLGSESHSEGTALAEACRSAGALAELFLA